MKHPLNKLLASQRQLCEIHYKSLNQFNVRIVNTIAEMSGIQPWMIFAVSRNRTIIDCRKILAYVLRMKTDYNLKEIGRIICHIEQDHTTALHAISTTKDLMSTDDTFKANVHSIMSTVPYKKTATIVNNAIAMPLPTLTAFQIAAISRRVVV